jgi:hypothetical protein
MQFIFSTPVLIRHLWQLKTVVFLHRGLIRVVLLFIIFSNYPFQETATTYSDNTLLAVINQLFHFEAPHSGKQPVMSAESQLVYLLMLLFPVRQRARPPGRRRRRRRLPVSKRRPLAIQRPPSMTRASTCCRKSTMEQW